MVNTPTSRTKLRYRWSHRHPVHLAVVRTANKVLPHVPFALKYGVTDAVRRRNLPYSLLDGTSVAVQVGAPRDTLRAGRSRAMAFARRTAPTGTLLVIEPHADSVTEFRATAARRGLDHVTVVGAAAWNERTVLEMEFDAVHPAANFTAGAAEYTEAELARFSKTKVDAVPVDDLIDEQGLTHVDVISITTNGAEPEILQGLKRTIERDRPYVCLARTQDSYAELMAGMGYELAGDDDRGFTFRYAGKSQ